jgi:hypothetical protein
LRSFPLPAAVSSRRGEGQGEGRSLCCIDALHANGNAPSPSPRSSLIAAGRGSGERGARSVAMDALCATGNAPLPSPLPTAMRLRRGRGDIRMTDLSVVCELPSFRTSRITGTDLDTIKSRS